MGRSRAEYFREYNKRPKRRKYRRKKVAELRNEVRQRAYQYLGNRCEDCGAGPDEANLEFDHIDPLTKKTLISRMISDGYPWEEIEEELKKCQLLCSYAGGGCHQRKTQENRDWIAGHQRAAMEEAPF